MDTQIFQVLDGPSKFELTSLYDGNEDDLDDFDRRSVSFRVSFADEKPMRLGGFIEGVHREHGYYEIEFKIGKTSLSRELKDRFHNRAQLQYHTRTRKGTMVLAMRTAPAQSLGRKRI